MRGYDVSGWLEEQLYSLLEVVESRRWCGKPYGRIEVDIA